MKYYAVIDTNVVVSSLLNPNSVPGTIMKFVATGIIVPFINDEILNVKPATITAEALCSDDRTEDFLKQVYLVRSEVVEVTSTSNVALHSPR